MTNVTYVDFKARLEEQKTMNKIAAENFNAQMGYPMEALDSLIESVKPYALNPVKETEDDSL
tara:strand:+ start:66 stop:251 length:186 start_codon:yes stop_codon:yes gene_type:complete